MTARKMLAATRPTNPAAIHSIVSIKRSIHTRFMSAPNGWRWQKKTAAISPPRRCEALLRQGVVFGERRAQLGQGRVRIGADLLDALAPGLDQRLGGFLPQRPLVRGQPIDSRVRLGPEC